MANYVESNIPKKAFIALLDSNIDQTFVKLVSSGEKIRINDLKNPIDGKTLQVGLNNGVYEAIELSYPRSWLERNDNWSIDGIDFATKMALVTIHGISGDRYLSCKLSSDRNQSSCNSVFCNVKKSFNP